MAHATGILLADRGALGPEAALLAGSLALVVCVALRPRDSLRSALILVAAAAAGALALGVRVERGQSGRPAAPIEATLEGRVRALQRWPESFQVDLDEVVFEPGAGGLARGVRVSGPREPGGSAPIELAAPGERVRLRAHLRAARTAQNPGGRDQARVLERAGIGAVGRLVHPALQVRIESHTEPPGLLRLARARKRAAERLGRAGEGGALLAAFGLGARDGLPRERRDAIARLGLAHLLAVSGLNLVLVGSGAYPLVRRLLLRVPALAARGDVRRPALVAALGAAGVYALLAGWDVPVQRALWFLAALVAAFLRRRPVTRGQPLALAALAVLAADPAALFAPGAQLSFAASASLLFARPPAFEAGAHGPGGGRGLRAVGELLRSGALALGATAPIAAWHFGQAAGAGLLANLLAIPWTAYVLMPASLLASALALGGGEGVAVEVVLALAAGVAHLSLVAAAHAASLLPVAAPLAAPGAPVLALAAGLAALAVRVPSTWLRIALVLLEITCLGHAPPPRIEPAPPRAVFLDVGQGDAALVQGRSASVLVDAGGAIPGGGDRGRDVVLPALAALGVKRLDLAVASHADLDHRGGLAAVLAVLPVGELWLPPGGVADPAFAALVELARARGVSLRERGLGDAPARLGDLVATVLWPPRDSRAHCGSGPPPCAPLGRNDRSLVLRVEVDGRRVLLPGDIEAGAEAALLRSGTDLAAEVLKLAHHGSRSSSTPAFLGAVGARIAIASAPCAGRFGMPHAEVRVRAGAQAGALWWTGRDGAVLVGLGARPSVRGWASGAAPGRGCAVGH